jgi:multiple sugar transport system substrate-binding protein
MLRKVILLIGVVLMMAPILPAAIPAYAETPDEWYAAAAKPYQGITIRGVSERTASSSYMLNTLAPAFEKATGIKLEFELTSWDEMYEKEIKDMQAGAGIYDFVYIEQDWIYGALEQNWLVDMTKMQTNAAVTDPRLEPSDFTNYCNNFLGKDGHLYAMPFEAFLKSYIYRKDLFTNPEIMAAFKAKTGWDLRPAVNWDEYKQIAEFFTNWGKEKGQELWGSTVTAAAHAATCYEIIESIWPAWGVYNWGINQQNMKATSANGGAADSPRAKAALAYWVDMLKYAPPEARTSTWDEVAASFASGRAAQAFVYLENLGWIAHDTTKSMVTDKVGVAVPPLYPGVINEAALGKGYIGYYDGGGLGIPHSAKNKEAAWLWTQWVARKDLQGDYAKTATRVVRNSTFSDPLVVAADPGMGGYFTLMSTAGPLFKGAPPYPFHRQVFEVYFLNISKAISGEMTPDQACDAIAKSTDELLVKLGYAK